MTKKFYCSLCGIELKFTRKAVEGRGEIINLISPHECEGYAIHSAEEGSKTVLDILKELKPITPPKKKSKSKSKSKSKIEDLRGESTAPESILENFRQPKES